MKIMEIQIENKEEITNSAKVNNENAFTENLGFLDLLVTDKKERLTQYESVAPHIHNLLSATNDEPKKLKELVKTVLKGDVLIVKSFYEQEWQNLSAESKRLAISELLTLTGDKGTLRQASVAQIISTQDQDTAASIISYILVGNRKISVHYDYQNISKEKIEALKSRFFPLNGEWVLSEISDKNVLKALISFFSRLAEENKDFGQQTKVKLGIKLEIDFVRWLSHSLKKVDFDNETLSRMESRFSRLINKFPSFARDQLRQQSQDSNVSNKDIANSVAGDTISAVKPLYSHKDSAVEDTATRDGDKKISESKPNELKRQNSNTAESLPKKDSQQFSAFASAEQLLKQKESERLTLSSEIEVLSKLISERDSLLTKQKDLRARLESAYEETDKEKIKLKELRKNFDETEILLNKTMDERDKTVALQKKSSEEVTELKIKVEKATEALESERSEYNKSSIEEVEFKIENLKGELKQKLYPIFENKRQTDSLPNDEKLSKFLRDWFADIEKTLNKFGINP